MRRVALALETHTYIDKIQWVGGVAVDNGSDASVDKSFDTHFPIESKVESFREDKSGFIVATLEGADGVVKHVSLAVEDDGVEG
ncbi:hypothetical protein ACFX2H_002287 [Malus domestica]